MFIKKSLGLDSFTEQFFKNLKNQHWSLPKSPGEGGKFQHILWDQYCPDTKTRQKQYKKENYRLWFVNRTDAKKSAKYYQVNSVIYVTLLCIV